MPGKFPGLCDNSPRFIFIRAKRDMTKSQDCEYHQPAIARSGLCRNFIFRLQPKDLVFVSDFAEFILSLAEAPTMTA